MKELEELTREIREKIPRLMELEAGCKFTRKDKYGIIYQNVILQVGGGGQIADTGDFDDAYYDVYSDREGIETITDLESEIEDVIGKELMLNDVLEWHQDYYSKNSHFEVETFSAGGVKYSIGCFYSYDSDDGIEKYFWNLSKPYLKDQSPELIKFLHSLIKTKQ